HHAFDERREIMASPLARSRVDVLADSHRHLDLDLRVKVEATRPLRRTGVDIALEQRAVAGMRNAGELLGRAVRRGDFVTSENAFAIAQKVALHGIGLLYVRWFQIGWRRLEWPACCALPPAPRPGLLDSIVVHCLRPMKRAQ